MASSSLAAVYRPHATPVPTTPAAVAGAAVVIPAATASLTVAAIAPATLTTVAATTVFAAAVAGAVEVGGLVRQIVGVLRAGRPEDALGRGRVGAPERSQRARSMTVRFWVRYETGPVLPFTSRTDSRRSGSWTNTANAAATTWPAQSVPKCVLLSTAAMQWTLPSRKAPSFEMVDVTAAGRATAAAGGASTASAGGAPRNLMAAAAGWFPASAAGAR